MLIRKFLINLLFVLLGCLVGFLVARYLSRALQASPLMCIIVMFFFLTIFIILGQVLILKTSKIGDEMPLSIITHNEIYGWLLPRKAANKAGYPLNKDRITIGRDVKNDILLNHNSISRIHAELSRTEEGYVIRDAGSRNGLFVNNLRVTEYTLQQGDVILIGDLEFMFSTTAEGEKEGSPQN